MKQLHLIILLLLFFEIGYAQTIPFDENYVQIYNPYTQTINSSYDYSDLYDLDGDGKKDSLLFIGNGGAHVYYYLKIVTSSDQKTWAFPTAQIDFPYPETKQKLTKKASACFPQLMIDDLDGDKKDEIYLNFYEDLYDDSYQIPTEWKKQGVKSKRVILNFEKGKLLVKDYSLE